MALIKNEIFWNIEELETLASDLETQCNRLEENKSYFENIKTNIESSYQSLSGETYYEQLNINMETFNEIIKQLTEQIACLRKIINECYRECETNVATKVKSLIV